MKKSRFLIFGIVTGLVMVLGAWFVADQFYAYQGVTIDPPAQAADFTLEDQNGNLFTLSEQRGNVILIFFGYTNCPDVCPITLSEYKQIKAKLGPKAENVKFVFITVDPERDSVKRMQLYMKNFDAEFIALTSDRQTLEAVWEDYGVYQERQDVGSAAGYLVDHSARTYAIDTQGLWRINYPFGMEVEKIYQDIIHLLREG
ncbi:MAG TPA: SCO family protein [Anaerolineales bacterium]|nr:SCO family protein [Anaerolineales bacterium]